MGEILTVSAGLSVELGCIIKTLEGNADKVTVFDGANHVSIFQTALSKAPLRAEVLREHAAEHTEHTLSVGYGTPCGLGVLYFVIF